MTRVFLYFLSFLPPLRVIAVNWGIGEFYSFAPRLPRVAASPEVG